MKVFDRQKLGRPLLSPLLSRGGLAFRAMPIPARVVSNLLMAAPSASATPRRVMMAAISVKVINVATPPLIHFEPALSCASDSLAVPSIAR